MLIPFQLLSLFYSLLLLKVLDFLFSKPIFDSSDFVKNTNIQKRSSFNILNYLNNENIISKNEKERNRTYFFNDLIKIII